MENKLMTKDNVLLIEKHDSIMQEAVQMEDGTIKFLRGIKIFRIIKPLEDGTFDIIAQFDANENTIDLSVLKDYLGYYGVSVDYDLYNEVKTFVWNCFEIVGGSEDNNVFLLDNARPCTEEEVTLLNKVFPEYYDNAF